MKQLLTIAFMAFISLTSCKKDAIDDMIHVNKDTTYSIGGFKPELDTIFYTLGSQPVLGIPRVDALITNDSLHVLVVKVRVNVYDPELQKRMIESWTPNDTVVYRALYEKRIESEGIPIDIYWTDGRAPF